MNPQNQRSSRDAEMIHARARRLASEAIDFQLGPQDAEWLAGHLTGCAECQTIAEEYRVLHEELRGLPQPLPPRDLWARTSAALDGVERSAAARAGRSAGAARPRNLRYVVVGAAAGLIVVLSGVSLLAQVPTAKPGPITPGSVVAAISPAATPTPQVPFAFVDGKAYYWSGNAGMYQINSGSTNCQTSDSKCAVTNSNGTVLGTITSDTPVSAVVAPNARQVAVWTDAKIVVLPLAQSAPATVSIDLLTTPPSAQPTATPTATMTPTATPKPSPVATPTRSKGPVHTGTPKPAATPTSTPIPIVTPSPTATPVPAIAPSVVTQPTAILDGYEIVGTSPEFSPDGSWVAFSARPVDHSTGPDVYVWHAGDQLALAVTKAHADVFSGWFGSQILISEYSAGAITPSFSALQTPSAVPSTGPAASSGRVATSGATSAASPSPTSTPMPASSAASTMSYLFDPASHNALQIERAMFMPVVDPTGRYLVYWSGSVVFDTAIQAWRPENGDLYFDSWSDLVLEPAWLGGPASGPAPTPAPTPSPSLSTSSSPAPSNAPKSAPTDKAEATPSASASPTISPSETVVLGPMLPQPLSVGGGPGMVSDWIVRWDSTGQHVAIWVADKSDRTVGQLKLFPVDPGTGLVDVNRPIVSVKSKATIDFDGINLVYTAAADGKMYVVPVEQPTPTPTPTVTPTPIPAPTSSPS